MTASIVISEARIEIRAGAENVENDSVRVVGNGETSVWLPMRMPQDNSNVAFVKPHRGYALSTGK